MANDLTTRQIGSQAEELACQYLKKLGYEILERNFYIRGGELDIVALKNGQIAFFEVKARYSHEHGLPVEAITPWKVKHLKKTALFYMQDKHKNPLSAGYRIHLLAMDFTEDKHNPKIEIIEDIAEG